MHKKSVKTGQNRFFEATDPSKTSLKWFGCSCQLPIFGPKDQTKPDFKTLEWRHYIQGSGHTTVIFSDHKNLMYFRTAQKLNDRQARWSLYLSEFDIKLIHLLGLKMI